MTHVALDSLKEAQSYLFNLFFKLLEILLSQESSYFSHNPWHILQLKRVSCLEDINENVSGYGNHKLCLHSKI